MLRAAEYLKATKGVFPPKPVAKFDPKPFVLVNLVAVFGRSRTEAPFGGL